MTFAQVILDELLIFWAPLVLVCIGLPVKRAFLWQCGRIVNCHGAALFIVRLPKTSYQYTENNRHYKFPLCKVFFSPLHPSFLGNHIFSETEKQNKTGSGTPSASAMFWTGQECQNLFWTNDKKCSDIKMHYQQNFKSRSDAHLLKWMNTVETAVDQLFYCQSSAKAQKKSNILFRN